MKTEDIEMIADRTIEDLKAMFKNTQGQIFIGKKRVGNLRYLLIKNWKQVKKLKEQEKEEE